MGTAGEPIRCGHEGSATESCRICDPLDLLFWGRLPLGLTIHLREQFRAYREKPGASDARVT